jgi:ribonuclease/clavin/mitogillin
MNIVNVGYDSTNYYVLSDSKPRLLVDIGWPGTLPKFQRQFERMDIKLTDIPYCVATHYHPDHAGLAQELKNMGIKLIVLENQVTTLPALKSYMKPSDNFVDINPADNMQLTFAASRAFLARLNIQGVIIPTPGHSDDSVTLILDDGSAFTGDLPHPLLLSDDINDAVHHSWAKIRSFKVKQVYPGHGPVWKLE